SFIFSVHPVHVEAVTWLAARKEVLQGFFFFLAFYLYLVGREEVGRRKIFYLGLVLLSILLATLSKPSAVVFPGVTLLFEIAYNKNRWADFIKRHWFFFLISSVISAIFIFILIKVMLEAGGFKPYRGGNFINNFLISFYAFLYNIKLLVLTVNYSAAYTIPIPNPIIGPRTILFVGIFFLMFGLSLWSLKKTKVFFFSFFFFFIAVFPYLNILPISTLLADRYVFIASFSYCFLLGIFLNRLYEFRHPRFSKDFPKLLNISLFLFLLGGYSFMTYKQNKIWENSYTLWADAVEKFPESNTANAMMGVVYMELGMDKEAIEFLEKAVQILPYDYLSRNNLGIVYERLNQPEKALEEFLKAIWLKPDDESIQLNLSLFYQRQRAYEKAEEILKTLISKNERKAILHFRLGLLYKEAGRYQEAISEIERSLELAPHIINPYEELGDIYLSRLNNKERALYYYSKGIETVKRSSPRVEDLRWMIQDLEH
ncbi:MAG: tetratricopeptide repeat protein, partial [Thermodesulfobacteriota bacterium]